MPRYVALFRGINVGKAKRIAMADLRALLVKLGYSRVATLLNSGNVVFSGDAQPAARHGVRIRAAVANKLGVDALVIVKSRKAIADMLAENGLQVGKHAAYLWCANGILESQVATGLLNGLKGVGTTRNWATLNKIHALMTDGS